MDLQGVNPPDPKERREKRKFTLQTWNKKSVLNSGSGVRVRGPKFW